MTYPLIGNYGRLVDDDQSIRPWLRGARRRQRHGRGPRRRAPARGAAARRRHPGHRRRRHAGPRPPPARERLPARDRDRRPATIDRDAAVGRGAGRAALGGPGLRRPGVAVGDHATSGDADDGGPLIGDRRLRAQGEHRPGAAPPRRAGPGPAAHASTPADVLAAGHRRRRSCRPGPGDPARLDGPVALAQAVIDDGRPLLGICLGHQIVGRAAGAETRRLRFGHHGANHPVQDLDIGLVQVTAQNHEVQVVGDVAAARRRLPGQPGQPQRRLGRGAAPPRAADRDRPVPPRGRARAARRAGRLRPVRGRARRPRERGAGDPPRPRSRPRC